MRNSDVTKLENTGGKATLKTKLSFGGEYVKFKCQYDTQVEVLNGWGYIECGDQGIGYS